MQRTRATGSSDETMRNGSKRVARWSRNSRRICRPEGVQTKGRVANRHPPGNSKEGTGRSRHRGNAMPASQLESAIHPLRTSVRKHEGGQVKDAELLERFIAHRDEGAFELLVRRHGPMVLGVCKRVLGNAADAEDAFQATFLVLVLKAAALTARDVLGDWL